MIFYVFYGPISFFTCSGKILESLLTPDSSAEFVLSFIILRLTFSDYSIYFLKNDFFSANKRHNMKVT